MDLRENIDRELMSPPADPFDLPAALVQGRRAVRRRRMTSVLAGAAAAAVVGATGLFWGLAPAEDGASSVASDAAKASDPCPSSQVVQSSPGSCDAKTYFSDDDDRGATYTLSGDLVIRKGWEITQRLDNPIEQFPRTVALEVTDGAEVGWTLMMYTDDIADGDADGSGGVYQEYGSPRDFPATWDFETWLEFTKSRWLGTPTTLLVDFDSAGRLEALPGWTIDVQRTGLDMGPGYRGPEGVSAVMKLGGTPSGWYLVRPSETGAEAFQVMFPFLDGREPTVEGLLDYVHSPAYRPGQQGYAGNPS